VKTIPYILKGIAKLPPISNFFQTMKYALLIGLTYRWSAKEFRRLGTIPSIQRLRDTLVGDLGFKRENVEIMTDSWKPLDRTSLVSGLIGLAAKTKLEDELVVLLAGHGSPHPVTPSFYVDDSCTGIMGKLIFLG
jgi:hypothetical protein